MTVDTHRRYGALLLLLCGALLPWGAAAAMPLFPATLTGLLLLVLCGDVIDQWRRGRRLLIPFDLIWPAVLLAGLGLAFAVPGGWFGWVAATLFFALLQSSHVQRNALPALQVFALSSGCCALLNGVLILLWRSTGQCLIFPTALLPHDDLFFIGPGDAEAYLAMLLAGLGLSLAFAAAPAQRGTTSVIWMAAAAAQLLPLILSADLLLRKATGMNLAPWYQDGGNAAWLLLWCWLHARIAAKIFLTPHRHKRAHIRLLGVLVLVMTLLPLLFSRPPGMAYAVFLALLAATALPHTRRRTWRLRSQLSLAPAMACAFIAVNLAGMLELSPVGARDYSLHFRQALAAEEDPRSILEDARYISRLRPAERQSYLWQARMLLEAEDPKEAALMLIASCQPGPPSFAGPAPRDLVDELVQRLRDQISALPEAERGIYFEQVLWSCRSPKAALTALKTRISPVAGEWGPRDRLLAAVCRSLGAGEAPAELAGWTNVELVGALVLAGLPLPPEGADTLRSVTWDESPQGEPRPAVLPGWVGAAPALRVQAADPDL